MVELITVVLLLGILSAVAIARIGNSSDFEPRLFTSNLAEQYRFAQGLSGGRYKDPINFTLIASTDRWQFVTRSNVTGEVRREEVITDDLQISARNGASNLTLNSTSELNLQFTPAGDIASITLGTLPLDESLGLELQIVGDSTHQLCVYPTGYLSNGNCE